MHHRTVVRPHQLAHLGSRTFLRGEAYVCGKRRQGLMSDKALTGPTNLVCYEHSDLSKEEIAELVTDSLASVGLKLVMYDEPTAGLDPIASTVVEDLFRSVHVEGEDARGKSGKIASYVAVTHQHSTIRRAVDRALFLHEGKVLWQGTTGEFETTSNPIVRQFAEGSLKGPIRY